MRFLYVTDSHLTRAVPKYRTPQFFDQIMAKWAEVYAIAKERKADFVLHGGDLYHNDNPDVDVIVETIKRMSVPTYITVGNHDYKSDSYEGLDSTAIGLMERSGFLKLTDKDIIIKEPVPPPPGTSIATERRFLIRLSHYLDKKNADRFTLDSYKEYDWCILVCHDTIVNEPVRFKHVIASDIKTRFDLVLCGHYHYPFKMSVGNTLFINPGSMVRLTRDKKDMERMPQVLYVEYENGGPRYELVPLKSAVPWQEAFMVDKIEDDIADERKLAEEFVQAVQTNITALNAEETLETVAKEQGVDRAVVETCRTYLKRVA